MISILVFAVVSGLALMFGPFVYLDLMDDRRNKRGQGQKGFKAHDRERGRLYWYMRAKKKLNRQVAGLEAQLHAAREENNQLERSVKEYRAQLRGTPVGVFDEHRRLYGTPSQNITPSGLKTSSEGEHA